MGPSLLGTFLTTWRLRRLQTFAGEGEGELAGGPAGTVFAGMDAVETVDVEGGAMSTWVLGVAWVGAPVALGTGGLTEGTGELTEGAGAPGWLAVEADGLGAGAGPGAPS